MRLTSIPWRLAAILVLAAASVIALLPRNTTERAYDPATGQMRDTVVRRVPISLGLDLRGGTHLALEVDQSKATVMDCEDAIRRAERIVRTRISEFGTTEPVVQVAGNCRLIVEIPGESDPARAKAIVQRTAFLEFRITDTKERFRESIPAIDEALQRAGVAGPAAREPGVNSALFGPAAADSATQAGGALATYLQPGQVPGEFVVAEEDVRAVEALLQSPVLRRAMPRGLELKWGTQLSPEYRTLYALEDRPIITGEDVQDANAALDPMTNESEVQFQLTRNGGRSFGNATARNIGNNLAILLDGRVQDQPPVIQERIESSGRIMMGGKPLEEANDVALMLRAGALPAPLHVVEDRTIGPSLGSDSTQAGVRASILAVVFVLLVMGAYYGRAGLLAVGALFFYVVFCAGALAAFGFSVTLPGLAGFALSIGMAVDANVLIFERMREEIARGKPLSRAVEEGFRNAMGAIVDSNVTTALTAIVLYVVGTESVRGFAITLLVGLAASMVSAIFVTRTFFMMWLERKPRRLLPGYQLFTSTNYDFIRLKRWAMAGTLALIVPGLIWLAVRGATYSIEFTGGAMLQIETTAPTETARLRSALEEKGIQGAEIQQFGSDRDFVIRARLASEFDQADTQEIVRAVRGALDSELGSDGYRVARGEGVSPKVSNELQSKALIAILFSFVTTLIYLAFRFEWRFGVAAVVATAHDVLATIAFIRYLDLEVGLVVVAAVLTILGYSLNDTIVIFDRIRENLKGKKQNLVDVLNRSINETLPRTVLTGGTTLATAIVLAFFAGEVIKPFALVMTFGIVVGTFSSIYIAAPVLLWIHERFPRSQPRPREARWSTDVREPVSKAVELM